MLGGTVTTLSREEARELATSIRSACALLTSQERVRTIAFGADSDGFDGDLWKALCQQVGVTAIALPTVYGGAGYGTAALKVVAHELGRVVAPVPFLASAVLATGLLADFSCSEDILMPLISGERTAAAVITGHGGLWDRSAVTVSARTDGTSWILDGVARHVLHGKDADVYVTVALLDGELAVFLVDRLAWGVRIDAERVLDGTRPMATATFSGASAIRLFSAEPAEATISRNMNRALAILSAEQVGSCEQLLELTTEYARTREQFGKAIGSFQAIKHMCANMLVDLEWARSASQASVDAADALPGSSADELPWRASMAKAVCSEALRNSANVSVQIHGGIGFSWEGPIHPYLRRARTDEVLFGTPAQHWNRLAVQVLPTPVEPHSMADSENARHSEGSTTLPTLSTGWGSVELDRNSSCR
jgi:alkylation response protein AidB-like acyl-CoA dehydrogenase